MDSHLVDKLRSQKRRELKKGIFVGLVSLKPVIWHVWELRARTASTEKQFSNPHIQIGNQQDFFSGPWQCITVRFLKLKKDTLGTCVTVIWSTTNRWLLHYCHPGSSKRWEENETGTEMNTVVVLKGEKPAQTLRSDRSAVPLLRTSCEADVFTASTVCCKARVLVSRSVKLLLSTKAFSL